MIIIINSNRRNKNLMVDDARRLFWNKSTCLALDRVDWGHLISRIVIIITIIIIVTIILIVVIIIREADVSKKCSFFEHCSKGL